MGASIYLVRYRYWNGINVKSRTVYLGRFKDPVEAEADALERYQADGSEVLEVRRGLVSESLKYQLSRFFIRCARLVLAAGLALALWAWIVGSTWYDVGDTPIATLTLNMVFGNLWHTVAWLGCGALCFWIAFGEAPPQK